MPECAAHGNHDATCHIVHHCDAQIATDEDVASPCGDERRRYCPVYMESFLKASKQTLENPTNPRIIPATHAPTSPGAPSFEKFLSGLE